jgi:hypothetical protein
VNAFLYLTFTSARNRIWFQIKRARNPRYLAAIAVGGFYLWLFLLKPTRAPIGSMFINRSSEAVVTLLLVLTLGGAWVFGSDTTALAFTQAEVSLLFPAPLTRRQLIGYKLYRAQIAVLINSLIWVFVLRRGGTALPGPMRALGIWILFSTLNLHRLGAALVRTSWKEHGKAGARRNVWSIAFFAGVVIAVVAGVLIDQHLFSAANNPAEYFNALATTLSRAPASIGLLPFHLVVSPTFATTIAVWIKAIPLAMLMLGIHVLWVLGTDTAFEEAAIEASAERARRLESFRNRRSLNGPVVAKKAAGSLGLATAGHPALAIFWKNMLCLRRTAQLRLLIGPVVMSLVLGAAVSENGRDPGIFAATAALTFAGMLLLFGGRLIRNDLRHDMLNLPMLKALPLSPRELIVAEVASSALPMAVLQQIMIVIAFVGASIAESVPVPLETRLAILFASPFAVLSLNAALLTIQNGLAVLLPAWMRLGTAVNSGVEMLGQNLMATLANLISLAFALIVPAIIAFVSVRYLMVTGILAMTLTIVFTSIVLGFETYGVLRYLGRALDRAEPAAT